MFWKNDFLRNNTKQKFKKRGFKFKILTQYNIKTVYLNLVFFYGK